MDMDFNEFNDFGFSGNDDFKEDNQLSLVGEAELKVLDQIANYTELTKKAVLYNEQQDIITNFRILSRYITNMAELLSMEEDDEFDQDTMIEKIQEIERSVVELGVKDLFSNDVSGEDVVKSYEKKKSNDIDDDGDMLDF